MFWKMFQSDTDEGGKSYSEIAAENSDLLRQVDELQDEVENLTIENQALVASMPANAKHKIVKVAGFDSTDSEPTDTKERMAYIAEVEHAFDTFLKDKLTMTVAEIRGELAELSSHKAGELMLSRDNYDFFLRGMEAMAWKMHDWAITLQGERRSVLQEEENNQ